MSYKTTIAKNLQGTLATTVDGDFVESNIEAGKSAVVVESSGLTYPVNKKKVMSKPFVFKKAAAATTTEQKVYLSIPYETYDTSTFATIVAQVFPEAATELKEVDILGDDPASAARLDYFIRDVNKNSSLFQQRIIIVSVYKDNETGDTIFGMNIYYPLINNGWLEYTLYRAQTGEKICDFPTNYGTLNVTHTTTINFGTVSDPLLIPIEINFTYTTSKTETGAGTLTYTVEYVTQFEWEVTLNNSITVNGSTYDRQYELHHDNQSPYACWEPPYPERTTGYWTQDLTITTSSHTLFPRNKSICLLATPDMILTETVDYSRLYSFRNDWGNPCEENIDPLTDCVGYYHDTVSDQLAVTHKINLTTASGTSTIKTVSYSDAKSYTYNSDGCSVPCPSTSISHTLCSSHSYSGDCNVWQFPDYTAIPSILLLFDVVATSDTNKLVCIFTHTYNKPNTDYYRSLIANNVNTESPVLYVGFYDTETSEFTEATQADIPNLDTLKSKLYDMLNRSRSTVDTALETFYVRERGTCPNNCDCDDMESCPYTFLYCSSTQEFNVIESDTICLGTQKVKRPLTEVPFLLNQNEFSWAGEYASYRTDRQCAYTTNLQTISRAESFAHQEIATLIDFERVKTYTGRPWWNGTDNLNGLKAAIRDAATISF